MKRHPQKGGDKTTRCGGAAPISSPKIGYIHTIPPRGRRVKRMAEKATSPLVKDIKVRRGNV